MTRHERDLDLIQRFFAGELDGPTEQAFWDAVASDEAFARSVTAYSMLESQLTERSAGVAMQPESPAAAPAARGPFRLAPVVYALAAAVVLAAATVAVYFVASGPSLDNPNAGPPVATLVDFTDSVLVDGAFGNSGRQYPAGAIAMDTGTAEFQLNSGTNVRLRGRTRLHVADSMNTSLTAGVATFRCPPKAVGFTVHLPGGAHVIDLGTAFTVRVDPDGRSYVYLHEGSVALHAADGGITKLAGRQAYAADADGLTVEAIDPADAPDLVAFDPAWLEPQGAGYAAAVLADEPVVYWRFDRAHDGRVIDQTGNGHDASLNGSSQLADGRLDAALRLEGSGFASSDAVRKLMVTDTYTIEFWARADDIRTGAIFSLGDAVLLEFNRTGLHGQKDPSIRYLHRPVGGTSGGLSVFAPYEPGRWYHVAAVKTPDTMTLYLDGEAVATAQTADPLTEPAPTFALGRLSSKEAGSAHERLLRGAIDEVAVYRAALSAEQIQNHHQAAAPARVKTENTPPHEGDNP